jgi:hypothetical protein
MNRFIKSSLFVATTLLYTGCATNMANLTGSDSSVSSVPSWYNNPMVSNVHYYYAVGEGNSLKEAKIDALNQIASEISVNISSSTVIEKVATTNSYKKKMQSKIKSNIQNIRFVDAKVIKNIAINNKYYVSVKVNRDTLFNAQLQLVENKYNEAKALFDNSLNKSYIKILQNQTTIEKLIDEAIAKLPILKSINANFDQNSYLDKLNNLSQKITDIKNSINVYVYSDSKNPYEQIVKSAISSYGLNLVDTTRSISHLIKTKIAVSSKPKKVRSTDPRLRGASFAEVTIVLTSKDKSNKIIAQNRVVVLNISKQGYNSAKNKTAKFQRYIDKKGILNILSGAK